MIGNSVNISGGSGRPHALFEWSVVEPLFKLPKKLTPTAWAGHIPFLFCLFKLTRPRTFVELGVFNGASMIAACTAASNYSTDTACYGIDTWQGDEHAGHYSGDAIFEELRQTLATIYPPAKLLRGTFDSQLERFKDGTIDILHIDGLHTYQAVKQDFESWLPKMSNSGIILFHDISVKEREFGVWKLWEELKAVYPSMEFFHSFGLGVLITGYDTPPLMKELLNLWIENESFREFFRCTCEHLGALVPTRFQDRINTDLLSQARSELEESRSLNEVVGARKLAAEMEVINQRVKHNEIAVDLWLELRAEKRRAAAYRMHINDKRLNVAVRDEVSPTSDEIEDNVSKIQKTGLFDVDFYMHEYQDVSSQKADPIRHYVEHGVKEGRWPNSFFDTLWYVSEHPEIIKLAQNPLVHYAENRGKKGVNPNPYFSCQAYLEHNPDVAAATIDPCLHFLNHGRLENRTIDVISPHDIGSAGGQADEKDYDFLQKNLLRDRYYDNLNAIDF